MIKALVNKKVFGKAHEAKGPAIFLDRDGVVIKDRHYIHDAKDVELRKGICRIIRHANAKKWKVVVITNQSGIGRGYFGWDEYELVTSKMISLLKDEAAFVDGIYACGNAPGDVEVQWRKPNPGMILEAINDLNIDKRASILIGDRLTDIEAGTNAGLRKCYHVTEDSVPGQREEVISWKLTNRKSILRQGVDVHLVDSPLEFPLSELEMQDGRGPECNQWKDYQKRFKALLLAGGFGTRLRPFTNTTPKCLAPVGGKPILGHWIERLAYMGCSEIIVNTHYLSEQVVTYLSDQSIGNTKLRISHEKELLGTAGTVRKHIDSFKGGMGLVIHADNMMLGDLSELLDAHCERPEGCILTMLTFTTSKPESCGIVRVDSLGRMKEFHEKVKHPPGNTANGAVYAVDDDFITYFKTFGAHAKDFSTDVIAGMNELVYTYHTGEPFIDIGTPQSLERAQELCAHDVRTLEE